MIPGIVATGTAVEGWILANATYNSVKADLSGLNESPVGIEFSDDGTKLFVVGITNDTVYQYTMSTPWLISSATYDTVSYDFGTNAPAGTYVHIGNNGTKMYIFDNGSQKVVEFTLNTAWSVSSVTYVGQYFPTEASAVKGGILSPDGTMMWYADNIDDKVYQYSLSAAWDITSSTYDSVSFSRTSSDFSEIDFHPSGLRMYILDRTGAVVREITLSTAWDLTGAIDSGNTFSFTDEDSTNSVGLGFSSGGTRAYICSVGNDEIYQYSLT